MFVLKSTKQRDESNKCTEMSVVFADNVVLQYEQSIKVVHYDMLWERTAIG